MVRRAWYLLLACAAEFPTGAIAQPELLELSLEQLLQLPIESVSGYTTTVAEAPATASVITAAQWQALGAGTVYDVLRYVPGLQVQPSSSGVYLQNVVSRGLVSNANSEVLWLLDGLPIALLGSNRPPATFDKSLANLRRIEVIKGPGSVIYGASAFSAVINLVSREAGGGDHRAGARAGRFTGREGYAELAGEHDQWRWRLSADRLRRSGDPSRIVTRDAQTALDANATLASQASLAPAPLPDGTALDELLLRVQHGNSELEAWHWHHDGVVAGMGVADALDSERRETVDFDHLRLRQNWPHLNRDSELQLEALYQRHPSHSHYRLFPPGTLLPIDANGNINFVAPSTLTRFPDGVIANISERSERRALSATLLNRTVPQHVLRASLGREWQSIDQLTHQSNFGPGVLDGTETFVDGSLTELTGGPFSYLAPHRRHLTYVSLQDDWRLAEPVHASLGLRHDVYSDFGSTTNPRFSLRWQLQPSTDLRATYGSAFRAPSFYEQGLRNNPAILGNPDLRPERIRSGEIALSTFASPQLQLVLTLFRYRANNLVTYAPLPPQTGLHAQNLSRRDGRGGEAELRWQPMPELQLAAVASVVDARDADTGAKLPDVPRQQYVLTGWYRPYERWTLGWAGKQVNNRVRAPGDNRPSLKDYANLDVNLGAQELWPGLSLNLAIRNLTDRRQREPGDTNLADDLPMPGRTLWFGLEYQWR